MKRAYLFALFSMAILALPFDPARADDAAARAMIDGKWNCTRAELGSGIFTYHADGTGEQVAKGLRYNKEGVVIEMDASTSITWTVETSGGRPTKIRQKNIAIEAEILLAEVNGVDVSGDSRLKEAFETKFLNATGKTGAFNVVEVTSQTLVLTTNKGRNDCYRLPDS